MSSLRRRRPLPRSAAAACLALPFALAAAAAEPCTGMQSLIVLAQSNFSASAAGGSVPTAPQVRGADATCGVSPSLDGRNLYHCAWEFPYRSAQAPETFDALLGLIRGCFGDSADLRRDQGVNHPDSYDLRQARLDGVDFSVSIKDKAALNATFVFLRVQGAARD